MLAYSAVFILSVSSLSQLITGEFICYLNTTLLPYHSHLIPLKCQN